MLLIYPYYYYATLLALISPWPVVVGQSEKKANTSPWQSQQRNLTFGVILPNNDKYASSIHRVLPVIKLAIQRVQADATLLPGWHIQIKVSFLFV